MTEIELVAVALRAARAEVARLEADLYRLTYAQSRERLEMARAGWPYFARVEADVKEQVRYGIPLIDAYVYACEKAGCLPE